MNIEVVDTKEAKESEINQRIEAIRRRNEQIQRRYEVSPHWNIILNSIKLNSISEELFHHFNQIKFSFIQMIIELIGQFIANQLRTFIEI